MCIHAVSRTHAEKQIFRPSMANYHYGSSVPVNKTEILRERLLVFQIPCYKPTGFSLCYMRNFLPKERLKTLSGTIYMCMQINFVLVQKLFAEQKTWQNHTTTQVRRNPMWSKNRTLKARPFSKLNEDVHALFHLSSPVMEISQPPWTAHFSA